MAEFLVCCAADSRRAVATYSVGFEVCRYYFHQREILFDTTAADSASVAVVLCYYVLKVCAFRWNAFPDFFL